MINVGDYYPPFLFKVCNLNIRKKLLEIFLQNEDPEGDVFKSIVWLTEENPDLDDKIQDEMKRAVSKFKKTAFTVKREIQTTRKDGFKKSMLGNINIGAKGEHWPTCNKIALNPVIQLAVPDLPHAPVELEGIKYLCVYIHPNDAGALLEADNALAIRTYTNEDLIFIEAPELINQESQPRLIEFERVNDYSSDYQYPSVKEYLSYSLTENYLSKEKMQYNWEADFVNYPKEKPWGNGCKILGWPRWVQWPENYDDSTLILQVDGYGLWDHGDSSTLYIFKHKITKEFWGTIQMA